MTKENLLDRLKGFFNQKAHNYGVELAFLYGSWAKGLPREDSDVDIAIVFSKKIETENRLFEKINDLSLELSKEINKEISIIPIFSDFRKPMLYYNAIILGKPLYVESADRYAQFFLESIYQMEDFNIFGSKWQLQAAAKNLGEVKKNG